MDVQMQLISIQKQIQKKEQHKKKNVDMICIDTHANDTIIEVRL